MKVTKAWLIDHRTIKGSWTKKQAIILGMDWPLKKGWMQQVIGREITDAERIEFELARNMTSNSILSRVINMYCQLNIEEKELFKRWLTQKH